MLSSVKRFIPFLKITLLILGALFGVHRLLVKSRDEHSKRAEVICTRCGFGE
jgi:hypothetical protein